MSNQKNNKQWDHYREDYNGIIEDYGAMYKKQRCNNGAGGCIYSNVVSYGTEYRPICRTSYPYPVGYPLRAEYYTPPKKPEVLNGECSEYSKLTNYGGEYSSKYADKCCPRRLSCSMVGVI